MERDSIFNEEEVAFLIRDVLLHHRSLIRRGKGKLEDWKKATSIKFKSLVKNTIPNPLLFPFLCIFPSKVSKSIDYIELTPSHDVFITNPQQRFSMSRKDHVPRFFLAYSPISTNLIDQVQHSIRLHGTSSSPCKRAEVRREFNEVNRAD